MIVEGGAVPALVKHLQAPPSGEGDRSLKPYEHEVEKGSAFALGLLAVKVSYCVSVQLAFCLIYGSCVSFLVGVVFLLSP